MIQTHRTTQGFTIIEILTVLVIIGILVTIASVSYGAMTAKARLNDAKQELATIGRTIGETKAKSGFYPAAPVTGTDGLTTKLTLSPRLYDTASDINFVYCVVLPSSATVPSATDYALLAVTTDRTRLYLKNSSPPAEYTGAAWSFAGVSNLNTSCQSVLPGSLYAFHGYGKPTWNSDFVLKQ